MVVLAVLAAVTVARLRRRRGQQSCRRAADAAGRRQGKLLRRDAGSCAVGARARHGAEAGAALISRHCHRQEASGTKVPTTRRPQPFHVRMGMASVFQVMALPMLRWRRTNEGWGDVESRQPETLLAICRCVVELFSWLSGGWLGPRLLSLLGRQSESNRLFLGVCSESEMDQMSMFTSR